eukprot:497542-Karenia_brevis.AAC.1
MANPTIASWRMLKKIARYLVGVESIVWKFEWQEETKYCRVYSDSDWGGHWRDRKSTSGGVWLMGEHCIKTWSVGQGAFALSSAEAE